ncbi:MAG: formate dehydrogenase accessory protein [Syntrophorhabdus sp. PtaU1.Bin002]|nr:MAG: formate dehydrogenase accessory protein [Syntrophorhabdus sp. PtaU1.Bin002]
MKEIGEIPASKINVQGVFETRDPVIVEEPLEIHVNDRLYTLTMRLVGEEIPLAAGLCFTDGMIRSADDLKMIRYCKEDAGNRIDLYLDESTARERATHAHGALHTGTHVAPSTNKAVGASTPASGYPARRSSLDRGYLLSDSGTPGTTHRHVTGPQVVPQCSLQEQPSVYAIRISHRFCPARYGLDRVCGPLRKVSQESCSCTPKSDFTMNKPLQKNIRTRFFLPDSHNRRGESGLSGRRHGGNASDVDELRVLAGRRRTERTSEGARRSRSPQMGIPIMPLTGQEKRTDNV